MRRLVLFVVLAFAAPVWAGSEPAPAASDSPPAATESSAPAPQPASSTSWSQTPLSENPQAKPEWKGPSGFWTNPYPAKGGAYRWRMMAIGGVLFVIMGWFMLRLVKKANAERTARK